MTTTAIANDDENVTEQNLALHRIEFHGQTLWARGGANPARTFVALKPMCQHLGLGVQAQVQKIQCHPVLADRYKIFLVPSDRGDQETGCLRLDAVNFWLATVSPHDTRRNAVKSALLVEYQRDCAVVLYRHFFGASQAIPAEAVHVVPLLREITGKLDALGWRIEDRSRAIVEDLRGEIHEQHDVTRRTVNDNADRIVATLQPIADEQGQMAFDLGNVHGWTRYSAEAMAAVQTKKRRARPTPGQQLGIDVYLAQQHVRFAP